jgi:hypothetical protein
MYIPMITELPMKCFRVTFPNNTYDVFIPDLMDTSSCVNITDMNGDVVPFEYWDNILNILTNEIL